MKILTKLILIGTMPVALLLALTYAFSSATRQVNHNQHKATVADEITNNLAELSILTYEHHIYFEERAHVQWVEKYTAIGKQIEVQGELFATDREKEIIAHFQRAYRNIGFLFEQYGPHNTDKGDPLSSQQKIFRNRITSRLLQELAVATPAPAKLHDLNHDLAISLYQQIHVASIVVVGAISIVLLIISFLVIRSFTVPIQRLNESFARLSNGELEHRIKSQAQDELGILSRGFDSMAQRLKESDESLRRMNFDLEQRVDARTKELSAANDELTKQIHTRLLTEQSLKLNEERLAALLALSQMKFKTEEDLLRYALEDAVRLTNSRVGYLHFFDEDQQTLGLFHWSKGVMEFCTAAKTPHYPLQQAGVWADCVRLRQPVVHNDYPNLATKKGYPEGHFPLYRHMSIPIFDDERVVAVLGVGNKEAPYNEFDSCQLSQYMRSTWDIVKLKRAQEESVFKAKLLDASSDSIFLVDAQGRIVFVNEAAYRSRGYQREEMLGMTLDTLDLPEYASLVPTRMQRIFEAGEHVFESAHRRKDGSILPVEIHAQCLLVKGERLILSSARDISERRQGEETLRNYAISLEKSNKELEHFAYVASHDLQEPLRKIGSFTELLARKYQDRLDDKAGTYINYIVDGAHRMQILINDLLTYSRVTTKGKEFAAVDCNQLLSRVQQDLGLVIQESGATIKVEEMPSVMADDVQLGQVFQNLIANAIKYRDLAQPPEIRITVGRSATDWVFSVQDNGIGIDPQHFERVFQLFQRLHTREEYSGTGIGLALCQRIIERHGGHIWVDSTPGQGSTFSFSIPISKTTRSDQS